MEIKKITRTLEVFTTFYNPPTAIHAIPKAPSQRIPVPQRRNGPSAGSLRDYSRLPHHPKHRKWTITPGVFLISSSYGLYSTYISYYI